MAEATSSAESIRRDIAALNKRTLTLPKDTRCGPPPRAALGGAHGGDVSRWTPTRSLR